jgi:hypothetical protein
MIFGNEVMLGWCAMLTSTGKTVFVNRSKDEIKKPRVG